MGECSSNKKTTKALKVLIALWMLYCFIICASYGGVVKAFLTSPQFSSAIETPQDVCTTQFYIFIFKYSKSSNSVENLPRKFQTALCKYSNYTKNMTRALCLKRYKFIFRKLNEKEDDQEFLVQRDCKAILKRLLWF